MKTWQKLKRNPKLFEKYFVKEYIIHACREFFLAKNYHELESPVLTSSLPQERYCDVLETSIDLQNGESKNAYLIPTTETFNKRILAAGIGEHFVISNVFRGLEEIGANHSPEFTMLEWYHLDATYFDLMDDCESLFIYIKKFIDKKFKRNYTTSFNYQDQKISLTSPWKRMSVREGLQKYAGIELEEIQELEDFRKIMKKQNYNIDENDDWQTLFELIFANEIEPNFPANKPIFVYDYPIQVCPLTKTKEDDPLVCEKVELYIAGKELANGYTELRDWKEQEKRFKEEQSARAKLGKKPVNFDYDLVEALKEGIPPVAGIGMGLDRVAMLFADAKNIADVNYFPAQEII